MFSPVKIALIRKTCCQRNTFFVPHYWKIFGSKAIATYNYLLSVQPDYVPEDINISPEEIDKQYQKLMQQIKG